MFARAILPAVLLAILAVPAVAVHRDLVATVNAVRARVAAAGGLLRYLPRAPTRRLDSCPAMRRRR